jgi:hypothetical protein
MDLEQHPIDRALLQSLLLRRQSSYEEAGLVPRFDQLATGLHAHADVRCARDLTFREGAASVIEKREAQTLKLPSDQLDRRTLEVLLGETLQRFGKVDILINCAGKIQRAPTRDGLLLWAIRHLLLRWLSSIAPLQGKRA